MSETTVTHELTETEQRNLRSVTDVLPYWNRQDIEGVLAYYDESITWRNIAMEETYRGKSEVRVFLRKLFSAFPDLNFEVTYKIARGDNVAEQWFIRGTHRGTFMGIPPTGRHVEIPGMSMAELRASLRKEGVATMSEVRYAILEEDGHVTVIPRKSTPA